MSAGSCSGTPTATSSPSAGCRLTTRDVHPTTATLWAIERRSRRATPASSTRVTALRGCGRWSEAEQYLAAWRVTPPARSPVTSGSSPSSAPALSAGSRTPSTRRSRTRRGGLFPVFVGHPLAARSERVSAGDAAPTSRALCVCVAFRNDSPTGRRARFDGRVGRPCGCANTLMSCCSSLSTLLGRSLILRPLAARRAIALSTCTPPKPAGSYCSSWTNHCRCR